MSENGKDQTQPIKELTSSPVNVENEVTLQQETKFPYKNVHVLIMSWKKGDQDDSVEVEKLQSVFQEIYGFHVKT